MHEICAKRRCRVLSIPLGHHLSLRDHRRGFDHRFLRLGVEFRFEERWFLWVLAGARHLEALDRSRVD